MKFATIYQMLRALQVCLISQLVSVTILWLLSGNLPGRWGSNQKNESRQQVWKTNTSLLSMSYTICRKSSNSSVTKPLIVKKGQWIVFFFNMAILSSICNESVMAKSTLQNTNVHFIIVAIRRLTGYWDLENLLFLGEIWPVFPAATASCRVRELLANALGK